MTNWFAQLRHHIDARADFAAREAAAPPRASSLILGMTLVMLLVVLVAKALTHLLTAI
jgi:hypothetical protein